MSDGAKLLFEGFLEKRKDTLKMRWTTYWFRLQNSTLFFYTQKNGSASHLRGYYYIYSVQSVREVQKASGSRYMFEMILKNGKQKLLAAETAALRQEWVGHLWQAMLLSTSVVPRPDACEPRDRNSSVPARALGDSAMETLPARPLSAPAPLDRIREESWASAYAELSAGEEPTRRNTPLHQANSDRVHALPWFGELSSTECSQDGDYDVLPRRKHTDEADATEADEVVYDYPLSYRMNIRHQEETESIYDVPRSLLRLHVPAGSAAAEEDEPQEGIYWRV
ncbi:uncharacterized protein LOC114860419 isoform X2 [Betta splendens]|uniref:Uncharacterized protein LOC114860419 isoform X2 n=1 Tax=Betta splendens TaxID=158456 RepID=A0A9W2XYM0_BETSP|nr:uncharacterized protein LOC114860419 isoform X2 [Betta splendens]